jgi:hypothetical protein
MQRTASAKHDGHGPVRLAQKTQRPSGMEATSVGWDFSDG